MLLIYLASFSNETSTKADVGSRTFIGKSWNSTLIKISTRIRNTHEFGSRHKRDHGFFVTRRPKNQFFGSTFAKISRSIETRKTEATVKPTVVTKCNTNSNWDKPYTTSYNVFRKVCKSKDENFPLHQNLHLEDINLIRTEYCRNYIHKNCLEGQDILFFHVNRCSILSS